MWHGACDGAVKLKVCAVDCYSQGYSKWFTHYLRIDALYGISTRHLWGLIKSNIRLGFMIGGKDSIFDFLIRSVIILQYRSDMNITGTVLIWFTKNCHWTAHIVVTLGALCKRHFRKILTKIYQKLPNFEGLNQKSASIIVCAFEFRFCTVKIAENMYPIRT